MMESLLGTLWAKRVKPYVVDKSIDIHTQDDYELAKILLK